jgi:hypothetical protein
MRRHQLEEISEKGGYHCRCKVCQWKWKSEKYIKQLCPGISRYGTHNSFPEGVKLYTFTGLKEIGMKPADREKPDGCYLHEISHEFVYLFDVNKAIKKRQQTEKQKAARAKAWETTQERYRCIKCKNAPDSLSGIKYFSKGGMCETCEEWATYEAEQERIATMITEDHQEAVDWATDLLTKQDFVILDTETTDLTVRRLVEIAVIDSAGRVLFQSVINPECRISEDAQAIHGITSEEIVSAPTLPEIWDDLVAILSKVGTIITYNAEFDKTALTWHAKHYKLDVPEWRWECLMLQYAAYWGDYSEYWGNYKWQPLGDSHRALGDCLASLKLLQDMATISE